MVLPEYFRCIPVEFSDNDHHDAAGQADSSLPEGGVKLPSSCNTAADHSLAVSRWRSHRQVDPTRMEMVRILFMYEDSNERLSLRRAYIKN